MGDTLLYLCGGAGALIYGFPVFLAAIQTDPPTRFALVVLIFSVFVGMIIAPVLVPMLGHQWSFLVSPEPYPLAVAMGLAANPLVPIFVRKMTGWADAYQLGGKKP
ncbi:hypothetical protein [Sphingomonas endolithica]|uniref:hypothetical protein n=1 Tax=Sphingomonas endolithica TaxID=2972485 RepID=UPI0021AEF4AA|nr:hypothetical protein [Sphingomonas sp. ZFBP2030]